MEKVLSGIIEICTQFGMKLIFAALVLIIGIKLSKHLEKYVLKSKVLLNVDDGVRKFIGKTVKIVFYVIIIISSAGILGIPYASFVAVLGSAGVAIGLALQGSLSNIAAGILILVNKPFKVGDYISAGAVEGTVSEIGFFGTKIVTSDNKLVSYPNSALSNTAVTDYTAMGSRRLDLTFTVARENDMDKVKELLVSTAAENSAVFTEPAPVARLSAATASALDIKLMVWCKCEEYAEVNFDLLENVKNAFDKNNIKL